MDQLTPELTVSIADIFGSGFLSRPSGSALPSPKPTEPLLVPADDGFGSDDDQLPSPIFEMPTEQIPEQPIPVLDMWPPNISLKNSKLMPVRRVFRASARYDHNAENRVRDSRSNMKRAI